MNPLTARLVVAFYARRREAEERIVQALPSLTQDEEPWTYGLTLMRRTRMRAGRFYPALRRLEADGVVEAQWDPADRQRRHRRRMYRLVGGSEQP